MSVQQRLQMLAAAKPTIHRNGSSKQQLMEDLLTAMQAIDEAIKAVRQTSPNGRDYYPQGDDAFRTAGREHVERLKSLEKIKQELEELAMHIHDQPDNR